MLIGLCGRYGAGKTTIANYLTSSISENKPIQITNVESYIINILSVVIMELSLDELRFKLRALISQYIGPEYEYPNSITLPYDPFSIQFTTNDISKNHLHNKFECVSFATPLKVIAALLFNIDLEILKGDTQETREKRDVITTKTYSIAGSMTGRQCLERLGTEIFRNNFDKDIWVKLAAHSIRKLQSHEFNIVIPDVRFANEFAMINELNGTIMVIIRHVDDLQLTDLDQTQHPAAWQFLTCLENVKSLRIILNDGSLDLLYITIENILKSM